MYSIITNKLVDYIKRLLGVSKLFKNQMLKDYIIAPFKFMEQGKLRLILIKLWYYTDKVNSIIHKNL